jgi:hypothetical protein
MMSKFPIEKRLDLGFLGQGWQGAELVLSGLTFAETKEIANVGVDPDAPDANEKSTAFVSDFLGKHFLRGKAFNGTNLVDLTKEDLEELPIEVVNKAVELLSGNPDPKS